MVTKEEVEKARDAYDAAYSAEAAAEAEDEWVAAYAAANKAWVKYQKLKKEHENARN